MSTAGIIAVNQLPLADAMKVFGRCCGSSAWAMQMARGRPYQDLTEMLRFADLKFRSLTRKDWLEAFIHLPDVSEIVKRHEEGILAGGVPFTNGADLTKTIDTLDRMLVRYHRKFGHKFIPLDENASLETLVAEISSRHRNRPPEEMELVCFNRRQASLRNLAEMMSTYRPQEGDGVTVRSTVSGENLPEMSEDRSKSVPRVESASQ
ncbi:MAG TPA: 2-oxo-4-hydroxy-4-carboxy-5-ureidoimidazoline decarboxylase [Rhodothermales bacterium]|nr:2-oxo-4-hydroxy-4-carboxy-5-ureidoimidazoline decarboxylase [Rhodothermales bacterium]